MLIDAIALLIVVGIVYLGLFFFSKGVDDHSHNITFEEKIYDPKNGVNKFKL